MMLLLLLELLLAFLVQFQFVQRLVNVHQIHIADEGNPQSLITDFVFFALFFVVSFFFLLRKDLIFDKFLIEFFSTYYLAKPWEIDDDQIIVRAIAET